MDGGTDAANLFDPRYPVESVSAPSRGQKAEAPCGSGSQRPLCSPGSRLLGGMGGPSQEAFNPDRTGKVQDTELVAASVSQLNLGAGVAGDLRGGPWGGAGRGYSNQLAGGHAGDGHQALTISGCCQTAAIGSVQQARLPLAAAIPREKDLAIAPFGAHQAAIGGTSHAPPPMRCVRQVLAPRSASIGGGVEATLVNAGEQLGAIRRAGNLTPPAALLAQGGVPTCAAILRDIGISARSVRVRIQHAVHRGQSPAIR